MYEYLIETTMQEPMPLSATDKLFLVFKENLILW